MIQLENVLVATDFSEPSAKALIYGRALAHTFGARLVVLHVAEVVTSGIGVGGGRFDDIQQTAKDAAAAQIQGLLTDEDRQALHGQVVVLSSMSPAESIVRYAKDAAVDVIVIGTHGRSGVAHMLMGSVAEEVVRAAPCPVLTVRHSEHDFVLPDDASTRHPAAGS